MDWMIVLGYVVLLLIQLMAIQALPTSIVASIFGSFRLIGIILGSILTWYLINFLWLKAFDYNLPFLALFLSLLFQTYNLVASKDELTDSSKFMIEGDMIAIVLIALYVFIFKEFNWI